ncbi:MAG TPA: S-adenosylmethionine tRNA ribosyltransferase [Cytophagales bacterium]|nr:S-adenosylmethionine tRNA ribosyltransferase [Cytophagales bacterium]HRG11542.1 S-adenosylmethionine:tRNA ribosyltransferase-isomerase [Cyclobacteriaceae bacterium]
MSVTKIISIQDYTYELPDDRIARFPLPQRDQSKLLVYREGNIKHDQFHNLITHLPPDSTLFFNNTRVIPARLRFKKDTGATIEIFLLHPVAPSAVVQQAMEATGNCQWQCTIGNLKRWPDDKPLLFIHPDFQLSARLMNRAEGLVEFSWTSSHTFAEVVTLCGDVPLPPYLNRVSEETDKESYQTVYSRHDGAVAAPTAGLHFTETVLNQLEAVGIKKEYLTLHVSAGTFQPVKTDNALEHTMHQEQVVVTKSNIEAMLNSNFSVAVGTTSVRTMESLYWFGVKLMNDSESAFQIGQRDAYTLPQGISKHQALTYVLDYMNLKGLDTLIGETSIYIIPGYTFRTVDALITNFHQPGSTLILLVAAFTGTDWRKIYDSALTNYYRFLSYGDSSLLFPKKV